ncbi:uncharacterized protein LOC125197173 [Salvia hispanica]|uniref:uncharacterized protein LOC125197173 n=1 Tax=Salvia hispanica TaxID=49212 RepID=UPI002009CF1F|nr:uncharacterized protein LOC125197173 [Salvia hispanica]
MAASIFLFVSVYTLLLFLSWNFLQSVLSWYQFQSSSSLGAAFGVLSMVAVPATLVMWITVLVVLAFCGKPRKKLTAEIIGFVVKVLIKEGNLVAAVCAVLGYFAHRGNAFNQH